MTSPDSHANLAGSLIIIAAPSGAGKTTLVSRLLQADPQLRLSVSYTTRQPRVGEVAGVHYHFVDESTFQTLIHEGALLEWAQVHGNYYGTHRDTVLADLRAGVDVILEIDWQGARQVIAQLPFAQSIFILPPSRDALVERLHTRGTDSPDVIAQRLANARDEIAHCTEFDFLVVNEQFEAALSDLQHIVAALRLSQRTQGVCARGLVAALLGS